MKLHHLTFPLVCLTICSLNAQQNDSIPKRILFTEAVQGDAPQIDGDLSDACWEQVDWSGNYQQFEPYNSEAPSQDTKLKVLYDAKNLYIAYRCYDSEPDKIERRMSRRDGFPGDWIEVNIDSYHDLRSAFSFTISASGVKGDEFVSNDGNNWDSNWNPIWYAKTLVDEEGWTAEIRIPLSQLRFGEAEEYVWGIQWMNSTISSGVPAVGPNPTRLSDASNGTTITGAVGISLEKTSIGP